MTTKTKTYLAAATLTLTLATTTHDSARAQHVQASLAHYSTDDGMASNAIAQLRQDEYGYIWIATWNGLSRFDGHNFYNYQTGNGSHIPYLHNRILDMAIDNQQNIWLRMYDGRIFVMQRSIDTIINPFEGITGSEDYKTAYPLIVTTAGDVLASITDIGLYKLHLDPLTGQVERQLINTRGLTVTSMAEGYQNDIWLGTNEGVHRMDFANMSIELKSLFSDEHITCLYSNGYNIYVGTQEGRIHSFSYGQEPRTIRKEGALVNALFVDSHGLVWFSDAKPGVLRIDPVTLQEKRFEQRVTFPDHDGTGGAFNEVNETVWMRMNHGGYGYYNRERDEVEYFHNDPSNPWNLSNNVSASLEMPEGVVWESTNRRGLEKLELLKNTISRTLLVPEAITSNKNETRALYYDTDRQLLLIGNKDNELFITHNDGTRTSITHNAEGQPLGRVYGISKDHRGDYWLSSKDCGIYRIQPNKGGGWTLKNYRHDPNDESSLNNNGAYATVEDAQGNIWVATWGGGVNVLATDKGGRQCFLYAGNGIKDYPYNSYMKVRAVALGPDGRCWAGTTDGILIMSMGTQGEAVAERLLSSEEDPQHILMSNDVVCMAKDRNGNIWVGTNGGGLAHTIGQDSKGRYLFENFGAKDGLPSEEIRSITFDNRGNVWFSTDHTICSFDITKRIFSSFSSLDGVDDTSCSENAAITLPNGNMLFGTINGYYTVDRGKLVSSSGSLLKLRITDFYLDNRLQSPRLSNNYDFYVPESRSVRLPGHHHDFSFRFASLNFQLQHRVQYQYMLDGHDRDWINADRTLTASYNGLPTGTYHFRVKAFLLESPEKFDMREIEIIVPPYFLLASKAIWLYMLLAAVVSLFVLFWKEHKLAQAEHQRRLNMGGGPRVSNADEADYDFVRQQQQWLEAHYTDPTQTAEQLVEASGMTKEDFAQQLRSLTGLTPRDFVNEFRIERAKGLLLSTGQSIAEVAFATGFHDATTFTRVFHQKTGMMPSQFRDQHGS